MSSYEAEKNYLLETNDSSFTVSTWLSKLPFTLKTHESGFDCGKRKDARKFIASKTKLVSVSFSYARNVGYSLLSGYC